MHIGLNNNDTINEHCFPNATTPIPPDDFVQLSCYSAIVTANFGAMQVVNVPFHTINGHVAISVPHVRC